MIDLTKGEDCEHQVVVDITRMCDPRRIGMCEACHHGFVEDDDGDWISAARNSSNIIGRA